MMDPRGWRDAMKDPQAKEYRWPLDAEKGREMDSFPDRQKIHENEKA